MNRTIAAAALAGFFGTFAPAAASAQTSNPTFSKDVAPILYKNCTNCHRPGEIGPMPLVTYKDARPWAKSIATRVGNSSMPPWHADDPTHQKFSNDRSLSEADRNVIVKWASGGAPEGNPKDLPALPKFADGWMMGTPDAVFPMQEAYPIPASGTLDYKFFEIPTNLTEDKWLQAFEIRPGDRSVVHHVIAYVRAPTPPRDSAAPAASAPQPGAPRPAPPFAFAQGMISRFEGTTGHLSQRLVAALEGGQAGGGDKRGQQSAALVIVKKNCGVWLHNDTVLRLQVDDNPEPIKELKRLVDRWNERKPRAVTPECKP